MDPFVQFYWEFFLTPIWIQIGENRNLYSCMQNFVHPDQITKYSNKNK